MKNKSSSFIKECDFLVNALGLSKEEKEGMLENVKGNYEFLYISLVNKFYDVKLNKILEVIK